MLEINLEGNLDFVGKDPQAMKREAEVHYLDPTNGIRTGRVLAVVLRN